MSSYSTSSMPSPPMPYLTLSEDHLVYTSDPECSSPDPHYFPEPMPSPALSAVSHVSSSLLVRSAYEQQLHDEQLRSSLKLGSLPLNLSALPLRFPRARSRKNGGLVRYPIIHIISLAIRGSPRQALTLSQIYETVEENLASYRPVSGETARDKAKRIQWQSSVRHSLSLQFMFVQVDRLPDDADEKLRGNYWTLDPSKYGLSRRSVNLEEKKKAMAAVAQKKKSASPPRKTSPARRRSRARKSLSPAPQHQRDQLWPLPSYISHVSQPHPQRYEPYELAQYPHLSNPSLAHPRDLSDLPSMDLPRIHPIMTSISSIPPQVPVYQVDSYPLYPHYLHLGQYQQPDYYGSYDPPMSMSLTIEREYEPEQGISPSLLHAPIPAQSQEESVPPVVHGRSLRSTVSRQRRGALIPC